jgi:type II secretory pathway pseudopilin PulG
MRVMQRKGQQDPEQGFSLIEVVIAIGVLAGVLLSIASMFILGGRQVKTGKTLTEATALAQGLMEQFDKESYNSLYLNLGAVATDTTRTVLSTSIGSPIQSWQTEIARKLNSGLASVRIDAMGPSAPNFGSAAGIKVTVTLNWNELGRQHSVAMSTVRF